MKSQTAATNLAWYLERVKTAPLLSAKQECQLARRIREHSDPLARQQMINSNLLLVVKIAKEFSGYGMPLIDLIAEGNIGLMRAVEDFDPEQGVRFSTYSSWWIKQSIKKALINTEKPVHIPVYLSKLISKWKKVERELKLEFGRPATLNEIAFKMGISEKKAQVIQQGLTAAHIPTQMGGEDTPELAEIIYDTSGDTPDKHLIDESLKPMIEAILGKLDRRTQDILRMRFGLDSPEAQPMTYKEIGEKIGLTRERVRQLEKKALKKLKEFDDDIL